MGSSISWARSCRETAAWEGKAAGPPDRLYYSVLGAATTVGPWAGPQAARASWLEGRTASPGGTGARAGEVPSPSGEVRHHVKPCAETLCTSCSVCGLCARGLCGTCKHQCCFCGCTSASCETQSVPSHIPFRPQVTGTSCLSVPTSWCFLVLPCGPGGLAVVWSFGCYWCCMWQCHLLCFWVFFF